MRELNPTELGILTIGVMICLGSLPDIAGVNRPAVFFVGAAVVLWASAWLFATPYLDYDERKREHDKHDPAFIFHGMVKRYPWRYHALRWLGVASLITAIIVWGAPWAKHLA